MPVNYCKRRCRFTKPLLTPFTVCLFKLLCRTNTGLSVTSITITALLPLLNILLDSLTWFWRIKFVWGKKMMTLYKNDTFPNLFPLPLHTFLLPSLNLSLSISTLTTFWLNIRYRVTRPLVNTPFSESHTNPHYCIDEKLNTFMKN